VDDSVWIANGKHLFILDAESYHILEQKITEVPITLLAVYSEKTVWGACGRKVFTWNTIVITAQMKFNIYRISLVR
jgi:hypothetical protein